MLIGGAVTDRFSPRAIMLSSDLIRLALSALMAALILSDSVQLWMVYAFSVAFGTVAGFFTAALREPIPNNEAGRLEFRERGVSACALVNSRTAFGR